MMEAYDQADVLSSNDPFRVEFLRKAMETDGLHCPIDFDSAHSPLGHHEVGHGRKDH